LTCCRIAAAVRGDRRGDAQVLPERAAPAEAVDLAGVGAVPENFLVAGAADRDHGQFAKRLRVAGRVSA